RADEGLPALPAPEALARQVDRHERRRAIGVDDQARTFEPEEVREPAGRGVPRRADRQVQIGVAAAEAEALVLAVDQRDEHAGGAPPELLAAQAGVLDRLPADLEEQPVLRIAARGLTGRQAEEAGVERVDVRQEATARRHDRVAVAPT